MKSTGIIRRVDDLGRIVLPKEVRRAAGITWDTPMEIFFTEDGVVLKKYHAEEEPLNIVNALDAAIDASEDHLDEDKVYAIRQYTKEIRETIEE